VAHGSSTKSLRPWRSAPWVSVPTRANMFGELDLEAISRVARDALRGLCPHRVLMILRRKSRCARELFTRRALPTPHSQYHGRQPQVVRWRLSGRWTRPIVSRAHYLSRHARLTPSALRRMRPNSRAMRSHFLGRWMRPTSRAMRGWTSHASRGLCGGLSPNSASQH
jgi:hypothetical protein